MITFVPTGEESPLETYTAWDARPVAAVSPAGEVLVLWEHSTRATGSDATWVAGTFSTDGAARSWSAPSWWWDDWDAGVGVRPAGAAYIPARGTSDAVWLCLVREDTYSGSTITGSSAYVVEHVPAYFTRRVSEDPIEWSAGPLKPATSDRTPTSLVWHDDHTEHGVLWALAEGAGGPSDLVAAFSIDRGHTWQDGAFPGAAAPLPGMASAARDAQLAVMPDGTVLCAARLAGSSRVAISRRSPTTGTWSPFTTALEGVTGRPSLVAAASGTSAMLVQDPSLGGASSWASATGDATAWQLRGPYTAARRPGAGAAVVEMPSGHLLVAYAVNDAGADTASVFATWFAAHDIPAQDVSLTVDVSSAPAMVVTVAPPLQPGDGLWRCCTGGTRTQIVVPRSVTYDPNDTPPGTTPGDDPVEVPPTVVRDGEAPIGEQVWYEGPRGIVTPRAQIPVSVGTWLAHPGKPDLACRVTVRDHQSWTQTLEREIVEVPGRVDPFVAVIGPRRSAGGSITVKVRTRTELDDLTAILADGSPLLLRGGDPDFAGWVSFGDAAWTRLAKSFQDTRRTVEVDYRRCERPAPVERNPIPRIADLTVPIQELTLSFNNGLMRVPGST